MNHPYKDALGNDILVGSFYGYTNEQSCFFKNRRIMVTELTKNSEGVPIVLGYSIEDNYYRWQSAILPTAMDVSKSGRIENFGKFWPLSDEAVAADPNCQAILEFAKNPSQYKKKR